MQNEKKSLRKTSASYIKIEFPPKNTKIKEEESCHTSISGNSEIAKLCEINNPPKDLNFFQKTKERTNSFKGFENVAEDFLETRQSRLKSESNQSSDSSKKDLDNYKKNYKTEICKNFEFKGVCPFGTYCCFAHGEKELRSKLNENFYYKTKFCEKFFQPNFCPYGYRCQYLHKTSYNKYLVNEFFEGVSKKIEENSGFSFLKDMPSFRSSKEFCFERLTVFKSITKF